MNNFSDEDTYRRIIERLRHIRILLKPEGRKVNYYNIECAFDLEASSLYISKDDKGAYSYIWMMGIGDDVIYGRKLEEFVTFIKKLSKELNLSERKRLVVYVHNLAYDFQFIRKYFKWIQVFATKKREIIYGVIKEGIEFRCSYRLTNMKLSDLTNEIKDIKIKKMTGDLDYKLIRNSITPLTKEELNYCEYDIRIILQYIREKLKYEDTIVTIPLTKTGYVRRFCRSRCLINSEYSELIKRLKLTPRCYTMLKAAFQGGYTHANPYYSGHIIENEIKSYDFNSSYPAVMIAEKFPMSPPKKRKIKRKVDLYRYIQTKCCLIDVTFYELNSIFQYDNYIYRYKAREISNPTVNNGRIVSADKIRIIITEIDWEIIHRTYQYKSLSINNFITFDKNYLPKDFIMCILSLYNDKTRLKGIKGKETEYSLSKSMCNSAYGMTVTDIVRDDIIYDNEWSKELKDINKEIGKYNKDKRRFLYYPWGVWVTAYARLNLWEGIIEFNNDYIYSDTDSVKVINAEKHKDFIENYNINQINKLKKAMEYHKLDYSLCEPCSITGDKKTLGLWENDGIYKKFKTLGAKRYMYTSQKDNTFHITIAGVDKKQGAEYLMNEYTDPYSVFDYGLTIPAEGTGKLTHTYIDEEKNFDIIDYMNNGENVTAPSGIHMEGCDYTIEENSQYIEFLRQISEEYREI